MASFALVKTPWFALAARCSEPSLSQRPCLACELSSAGGQAALGGRGERGEHASFICKAAEYIAIIFVCLLR